MQFIGAGGFASADRERGRFRTYLLGAMKHYLANEWHRSRTQRRGGRVQFLEWDALEPEALYALEPRESEDPEVGFDREWALAVTSRAMERLRGELETDGRGEQFAVLQGGLTGAEPPRREAAAQLGMTEGAVKVLVHRLRRRYRELLRAEIGETVIGPEEIDAEMRHLAAVLRAS